MAVPLRLVGGESAEDVHRRRAAEVGETQHDAVIGRLHLYFDAEPFAHAPAERHAPWRVDAAAEWRVALKTLPADAAQQLADAVAPDEPESS